MQRRSVIAAAAAFAATSLVGLAPASAQSDYPSRPIQMIVPWGAGGGTDAVGRVVASILQDQLGVPVNVVNRTGGSGVVGHNAIASADPDGYTIGIMTIEIDMMHWQGLTDLTYKDYDILGLVNADPGSLMVAADSPYKTADDLLKAIKEKPAGTFKASGTGQGGIWNLGLYGWLMSEDVEPTKVTWVPSEGAAPGITDMVAGGVDIVPSSLPEGRAMIEAGRVHPLAVMAKERQDLFPDVPTLKEAIGSDWTIAAWRAVVAPKGLPDDVEKKLTAALDKAYHSNEYKDFMTKRGLGMTWKPGPEATQMIADDDAALGKVMKKAGLAK